MHELGNEWPYNGVYYKVVQVELQGDEILVGDCPKNLHISSKGGLRLLRISSKNGRNQMCDAVVCFIWVTTKNR